MSIAPIGVAESGDPRVAHSERLARKIAVANFVIWTIVFASEPPACRRSWLADRFDPSHKAHYQPHRRPPLSGLDRGHVADQKSSG
jgi:hypothetical protein